MASRRNRKRERLRAEATAPPKVCGGWGQGLPTSLADLVLLRRAINQDRPVSAPVRQAIVDELGEGLESNNVRPTISIARTFIATDLASSSAHRRRRIRRSGRTQRIARSGAKRSKPRKIRGLCGKSRQHAT